MPLSCFGLNSISFHSDNYCCRHPLATYYSTPQIKYYQFTKQLSLPKLSLCSFFHNSNVSSTPTTCPSTLAHNIRSNSPPGWQQTIKGYHYDDHFCGINKNSNYYSLIIMSHVLTTFLAIISPLHIPCRQFRSFRVRSPNQQKRWSPPAGNNINIFNIWLIWVLLYITTYPTLPPTFIATIH